MRRILAFLGVVAVSLGLAIPATAHHRPYYERQPSPEPAAAAAVTMTDGRQAYQTYWLHFAGVAGVNLRHPSAIVERIGLHQSNHEGAFDLTVLGSSADAFEMPSRGRYSGLRSAADIVVQPDTEIRAPVSGTVLRSGSYVLYCDYTDDFLVIAPDEHPEWELKMLHIDGVRVEPGDRVEAGVTVVAPRARVLPFSSQVEDYTASPAWPHTHVELIDTAVPDRPNPGSGGC